MRSERHFRNVGRGNERGGAGRRPRSGRPLRRVRRWRSSGATCPKPLFSPLHRGPLVVPMRRWSLDGLPLFVSMNRHRGCSRHTTSIRWESIRCATSSSARSISRPRLACRTCSRRSCSDRSDRQALRLSTTSACASASLSSIFLVCAPQARKAASSRRSVGSWTNSASTAGTSSSTGT